MYRYTVTEKPITHADHVWEEWNGYLDENRPLGIPADSTGICCHTCSAVVVDRPEGRCPDHPAYEADYCPVCGTAAVI